MSDITFPKAGDILPEIQQLMGEVSGPSVQLFGEDATYSALRRAFDLTIKKRPWEQYLRWDQLTIDGSTGKVTATDPFGDITCPDLSDFIAIYRNGESQALPLLSNRVNPYIYTGTTVRFWTSLPYTDSDFVKKRLQFWPKTATTVVNSLVRVSPSFVDQDTTLYLDKLMLVTGTAWQCLAADGTNPEAADVCKELFDLRFRDILRNLASQPLEISDGSNIPTDWFVKP